MSPRWFGSLTAPNAGANLTRDSVLCLPVGSYEQHGPHLPLHTDTVIAEEFTRRMSARYGAKYDLWTLPTLPFGLSLEHAAAPGTISLTTALYARLLDAVVGECVRATPARNLVIVNGHGGNRGVLEALLYELRRAHGVNICVLHPSALSTVRVASSLPEIHAGMRETSVMLALAPSDVHLDRIREDYVEDPARRAAIERFVLHRGATWPWTSADPRVAVSGVIGGDPRLATAELGDAVINSALDACADVFNTLLIPS